VSGFYGIDEDYALIDRPWEVDDRPSESSVETVKAERPGLGKEQEAEFKKTMTFSRRRRVRETEDGRVVLEEQDLVFEQRKTVWLESTEAVAKQE
jgi:hypothetical protein